jgi:type VI protein secretion system component VasF
MYEEELRNLADADLHEKMSGAGDRSPQRYRMQQELNRRVAERVAQEYLRWTRFAAIAAIVAAGFALLTLIVTLVTRDG